MAYDLGRPKEDRYVPINDTAYKISFSAYLSAPLLYVLKQMMNEFCCKKNPGDPGVIVTHSNYDSTAVNTQRVAVQPGLEPEPEFLTRRGRNVVDLDAPPSEKETIDSIILSKYSEIDDIYPGIIFRPFLNNLTGYAESVADDPAYLPENLHFEEYGDGTFAHLILNNGIYDALRGSIVEAIQHGNGPVGDYTQALNTKRALTAIVWGYNDKGYYNAAHLKNWERILGVITDLVNSYTARFPSLEGEIKASKTYEIMELIKSLIENYHGTSESTLKDRLNSRDDLMGVLQITAAAQSLLKGANGDAALEAGAHPEPELAAAARRRPPPPSVENEQPPAYSPRPEADRRGPPPAYSQRPEAEDEQPSELFVSPRGTGTASVENEQPPAYSPRP